MCIKYLSSQFFKILHKLLSITKLTIAIFFVYFWKKHFAKNEYF